MTCRMRCEQEISWASDLYFLVSEQIGICGKITNRIFKILIFEDLGSIPTKIRNITFQSFKLLKTNIFPLYSIFNIINQVMIISYNKQLKFHYRSKAFTARQQLINHPKMVEDWNLSVNLFSDYDQTLLVNLFFAANSHHWLVHTKSFF